MLIFKIFFPLVLLFISACKEPVVESPTPNATYFPESNGFFTQVIEPDGKIASLNSQKKSKYKHTWWITSEKINPSIYSKDFLSGKKSEIQWLPIHIPQGPEKVAGIDKDQKVYWHKKILHFSYKPKSDMIISLGEISDRDRAYFNGVLIGSTGDWDSPLAQPYDKTRMYTIPDPLIQQGKNIILVETKRYFSSTTGMHRGSTSIGDFQTMSQDYYYENYQKMMFLAIYSMIGTYFLFLYQKRRKEKENLFFSLFVYSLVVYLFLRNQLKFQILESTSYILLKKIEFIALYLISPFLFGFIHYNFPVTSLKNRKIILSIFFALLAGVAATIGIVLISSSALVYRHTLLYFNMPAWVILAVLIGILIVHNLKRGNQDAQYIAASVIVFILAAVLDTLRVMDILNLPRILDFGFFFFVIGLAISLANKFVRLHSEVEDLNVNLERKVEKRTNELKESLKRISELKDRQDGDYFLTSLLIEPLKYNSCTSEGFETAAIINQKKKFSFKNKDYEIGGDHCMLSQVKLRNRNYIVFANGDAMGKSLQGAGGVLIMGVIVANKIQKTLFSEKYQRVWPEIWLKEIYMDLQDVYLNFDCSMMLTMIIGLIDEQTGFTYYINIDHPFSVLYRDGRASFLETDASAMKFGTPGQYLKKIQTLQLKKGDIFIIGSDGRDDIAITQNGTSNINYDETMFLRIVEESQGNILSITENLQSCGDLTDDLSLLSVRCCMNTEKIPLDQSILDSLAVLESKKEYGTLLNFCEDKLSIFPENGELWYYKAYALMMQKKIREAIIAFEICIKFMPEQVKPILYLSYCQKKARYLREAADNGERLLLLEGENVRNVINLIDIHYKLKNYSRFQELIEYLKTIDSQNKLIPRLGKMVAELAK